MSRVFAITSASNSVELDANGQGEVSFVVSNRSGRPLRGQARVKPLDAAAQDWLRLEGEAEREFSVDGTHQFTVEVSAPPGTRPGMYSFRLDVISIENPDEDFTEGPVVAVNVKESEPPEKPFPWWLVAVAAAVLVVVGGVMAYLYFQEKTAPVPDLIGETQARAEEMLQEAELEGEAIGRKYTGEFTPGEVQDQDPDPGESIPLGSTVEFIIEAQPAEVPPVIGEEFGRAVMTLLRAEFQVDEPTLVRNENMVGKVIDQAPKPGTKVEEGSVVHLSVGRSPLVVHPSWKEMLNPEVLEKMESSLNRSRLRIMDKIE